MTAASANAITVRFGRTAWLRLALPVMILAAASVIFDPAAWRRAPGWAYGIACGAVALFAGPWPLARKRCYLRLDSAGLTIRYILGPRCYPWGEIEAVQVVANTVNGLPAGRAVVLRLRQDSAYRRPVERLARRITKYDVSILGVFEMDTLKLATLLDTWRQRYANADAPNHRALSAAIKQPQAG